MLLSLQGAALRRQGSETLESGGGEEFAIASACSIAAQADARVNGWRASRDGEWELCDVSAGAEASEGVPAGVVAHCCWSPTEVSHPSSPDGPTSSLSPPLLLPPPPTSASHHHPPLLSGGGVFTEVVLTIVNYQPKPCNARISLMPGPRPYLTWSLLQRPGGKCGKALTGLLHGRMFTLKDRLSRQAVATVRLWRRTPSLDTRNNPDCYPSGNPGG
eukprot:3569814-Rhodomonas_salina.1